MPEWHFGMRPSIISPDKTSPNVIIGIEPASSSVIWDKAPFEAICP
jgi:hypothetical protein